MNTQLVIIDPQNDFCKKDGTLYVPGAEDDCGRLATFIERNKTAIDAMHITLDSHPLFHIAHPSFWVDANGNAPEPYTVITASAFAEGTWKPAKDELYRQTEEYLWELEARGHYNLIIWPPHCLTATKGFCVVDSVIEAARVWESAGAGRNVNFVVKTSNPFTEHYSAVQAEVPDKNDPSTRTNFAFIDALKKADKIIIAGEALSHCVANTIRDLIAYIPANRMMLLRDCTSSVGGFENVGSAALDEFVAKGLTTVDSSFCL